MKTKELAEKIASYYNTIEQEALQGEFTLSNNVLAHITALISAYTEAKDAEIERLELELIDAYLKTKDIEVIQKDKRIAELEKDRDMWKERFEMQYDINPLNEPEG